MPLRGDPKKLSLSLALLRGEKRVSQQQESLVFRVIICTYCVLKRLVVTKSNSLSEWRTVSFTKLFRRAWFNWFERKRLKLKQIVQSISVIFYWRALSSDSLRAKLA